MRGTVHALQETVAAVIDAVEHMGEIVVAVSTKTVAGRGIEHEVMLFACQDHGGSCLLQPEILVLAIEYFSIMPAGDDPRIRESSKDTARNWMFLD